MAWLVSIYVTLVTDLGLFHNVACGTTQAPSILAAALDELNSLKLERFNYSVRLILYLGISRAKELRAQPLGERPFGWRNWKHGSTSGWDIWLL